LFTVGSLEKSLSILQTTGLYTLIILITGRNRQAVTQLSSEMHCILYFTCRLGPGRFKLKSVFEVDNVGVVNVHDMEGDFN
jgi:hypothetical protein